MRVLAALCTALAVGAASAAGSTGSGVRGIVMRGPTKPVCELGSPCSAPATGVRLMFVRGDITRTTTTDDAGRYRIALAPGAYAVRIPTARFGYTPRHVVVTAGAWTVQKIQIDTGIR